MDCGEALSGRHLSMTVFKVRIVKETHVKGASVATVARRHNVNANQIFAWRQLYRQGLLVAPGAEGESAMLPVKVGTPTVLPTERMPPAVRRQRGLNGSSAATSSKPHGSGSSIAERRGHQGAGAAPDMGRLGNAVPR